MSTTKHCPDKWVVVKFLRPDRTVNYRVFACWYGSFAGADSWKINSGITGVTNENNYFVFSGASGSTYICLRENYGTHQHGQGILQNIMKHVEEQGIATEILPWDTDFLKVTWK
jgi:hypothetical protein